MTLANAALVQNQVEDLELSRNKIAAERPVVVEILRERAREEGAPFLKEIALWVSAGGDPDYAFHYLIDHERARDERMKRNTLVVPPESSQPRTIARLHAPIAQPNATVGQPQTTVSISTSHPAAATTTPITQH